MEYLQTATQLTVNQVHGYNNVRKGKKIRERNTLSMRPSFFWKHVYQFSMVAIHFNNWEPTDPQALTDNKFISPASALAAQEVGFALGETLCFRCGLSQNEEPEVLLSERWVWVRSWRRAHPVGQWEQENRALEPYWSLGLVGSWYSRWHPPNWNKEVAKGLVHMVQNQCISEFCWHFLTNGAICTLSFVLHSLCFLLYYARDKRLNDT